MEGFFEDKPAPKVRTPLTLIPKCGVCNLFRSCDSPKMPVDGEGKKGVLIVGEAPGEQEDSQGIPFCGPAGRILQDHLRMADVNMRRDCWVTNSLSCRPPANDMTPYPHAVEYCRPNVINAIRELKPKVIILLGKHAIESVIGWLWREDAGSVERWVGWRIPAQRTNSWICPTYHPSYLQRTKSPVLEVLFQKHLRRAVAKKERPWKEIPKWDKRVELIYDPDKAANRISTFNWSEEPVAFDYETNMMKPEADGAEIVCCSLSDGFDTIAFPWQGAAVTAMRAFLVSTAPKVVANLKFESSWTRKILGVEINNIHLDTVLSAHTLTNKTQTAGVKFQAFVRLGQESYDDHIKKYLHVDTPNKKNRIKEIPLGQLLTYNALDSLIEHKLYTLHKRELEK